MTREEMAALAQSTVNTMPLPVGARAVVVVTDADGAFVGVGHNTLWIDAHAMLYCALYGLDPIHHTRKRPRGSEP